MVWPLIGRPPQRNHLEGGRRKDPLATAAVAANNDHNDDGDGDGDDDGRVYNFLANEINNATAPDT